MYQSYHARRDALELDRAAPARLNRSIAVLLGFQRVAGSKRDTTRAAIADVVGFRWSVDHVTDDTFASFTSIQ
jgi:hypothetical protein